MGKMDDTERSHLIIDKDTQMVYDIRKDLDMARLDRQTSVSSMKPTSAQAAATEEAVQEQQNVTPRKPKAKPWANLWKQKRQNN